MPTAAETIGLLQEDRAKRQARPKPQGPNVPAIRNRAVDSQVGTMPGLLGGINRLPGSVPSATTGGLFGQSVGEHALPQGGIGAFSGQRMSQPDVGTPGVADAMAAKASQQAAAAQAQAKAGYESALGNAAPHAAGWAQAHGQPLTPSGFGIMPANPSDDMQKFFASQKNNINTTTGQGMIPGYEDRKPAGWFSQYYPSQGGSGAVSPGGGTSGGTGQPQGPQGNSLLSGSRPSGITPGYANELAVRRGLVQERGMDRAEARSRRMGNLGNEEYKQQRLPDYAKTGLLARGRLAEQQSRDDMLLRVQQQRGQDAIGLANAQRDPHSEAIFRMRVLEEARKAEEIRPGSGQGVLDAAGVQNPQPSGGSPVQPGGLLGRGGVFMGGRATQQQMTELESMRGNPRAVADYMKNRLGLQGEELNKHLNQFYEQDNMTPMWTRDEQNPSGAWGRPSSRFYDRNGKPVRSFRGALGF